MKELSEGVVIEAIDQTAKVRASIHSDCDHCGMCPGNNAMLIDVVNKVGAVRGDRVVIERKTINRLLSAFIMFLLPLLAVVLGIVLGYYLSFRFMVSEKVLMGIGGVVFGMITLYFIRRLDRYLQAEKPTIIEIKNK